jgi:archaellin
MTAICTLAAILTAAVAGYSVITTAMPLARADEVIE